MDIKQKAYKSIADIKSVLDKNGYSPSKISERDYNYELTVKPNNTGIKVQVYFGKKGVKTVIQGDANSPEFKTIQNLVLEEPSLGFTEKELNEPDEYIGSDECGKGDFFGPLVTAAAHVDKESQMKLKKIGVRDSKDLNEYQIKDLAQKIKIIIPENYEVIKINPSKYNELYDKFNNLNKLLNWAHSKAVDTLLQKTNCKTVITDKFSNKDLDVTFKIDHASVTFIQEHRAEKFVGVAAASILARDEFNKWFIHQKNSGFDLPKGASDDLISTAYKLLLKQNNNNIGDFAKLHFKTLKKISGKI